MNALLWFLYMLSNFDGKTYIPTKHKYIHTYLLMLYLLILYTHSSISLQMNISYSKYEHPQLLWWKIMCITVSNWLLWYFGMIGLRISFLLILPVLQTDQNFWTFYYTIGVFFIGTDHSSTSYYYVNKKMAKALQLTIGCMSRYRIKLRKIELFHFCGHIADPYSLCYKLHLCKIICYTMSAKLILADEMCYYYKDLFLS